MKRKTVCLRALEEGDLERVLRWHNDPALYATLGGVFRHVGREAEAEWLRARARFSRDEVNLAICLAPGGAHIGNLYLRGIDPVARTAELNVFIGEAAHRGRGYGAAAVRLALRHAFGDLALQRVYLHVLADNAPALKLYRGCGFREEGRLRRHAFKNGAPADLVVMGLLAEEFKG